MLESVVQLRERVAGLSEQVAQRDAVIVELRAVVEQLRAEVVELRARLDANSRNSSKPPSSDGLAKPAPKSLRVRTGRKPGGQPGHSGTGLVRAEAPDEVQCHEPSVCRSCGAGLVGAVQVGVTCRQVFDIPPPPVVRVVEHQLIRRECGCGTVTTGAAPAGVTAPVQYGPRMSAVMVYLYAGQFLSKARTAAAMSELFGTAVSGGTVSAVTARAAGGLDGEGGFLDTVRSRLAAAPVAHFDETGFRVEGKLRWVHSASTPTDSLITVHERRGKEGMDAAGVLPGFTGIGVHDAWAPYDTYPGMTHALCNAHVLRELAAVTEQATLVTTTAGSWCWAVQVADALRQLNILVSHTDENSPGRAEAITTNIRRYRAGVQSGVEQTRNRATKLERKHNALAKRLRDREDDYLRFVTHPHVPFDNNPAEREIRMIKLRQKISGTLRTLTGAEHFTAIRSYLATAHKHGIDHLDALTRLTTGTPWTPKNT